jgi:hypothetical protein
MRKEIARPREIIENKIYLVRGQKVMLDRDLAELYDVKAIRLREQVKRNLEKFPEHFMFQLTEKETDGMVSQNAIPSKQHLGGALPYVFTEHGALQLANVIKSGKATQVSIMIIDTFVKMRELITTNQDILKKLAKLESTDKKQGQQIDVIFKYIQQIENNNNQAK